MSSSATLLFTTGVLTVLMASWYVPLCRAKTYDRCQLASDLLHKYKLPANQISQCTDFFLFFCWFFFLFDMYTAILICFLSPFGISPSSFSFYGFTALRRNEV